MGDSSGTARFSRAWRLASAAVVLCLWIFGGLVGRAATLSKYRDEYQAAPLGAALAAQDKARDIRQFVSAYEGLEDSSALSALYWVAAVHFRHRALND
jgi:hypothetical protein